MPRVSEQKSGLPPKVSVAMVTYNHERFLAQAIESVLMQEVDFPVELVIGEDCSTDGTRAIVEDFSRRYPNIIRLMLPERNLGSLRNNLAVLKGCQAKYLAMLEGDDYWTSPLKLQKQVNFLEANPDCSLCFHDAEVESYREDGKSEARRPFFGTPPRARLGFDDFAQGFIPHTATCVMVNDRAALQPIFTGKVFAYALTIFECSLAAGKGAAFLPDKMSVYRLHAGGWFSALATEKQLEMANHGLLASRKHFAQFGLARRFTERLVNNYIGLARLQLRQYRVLRAVGSYGRVWALLIWPPDWRGLADCCRRHAHYLGKAVRRFRNIK